MKKTIAVLSTLDTKGEESQYLREQIEALGGAACLVDIGVVGEPGTTPDVTREEVVQAGGTTLQALLENPTRQTAVPVMVKGATGVLQSMLAEGRIHGVIGLGGTQGTPTCTEIMRALPYGFPKVMVSTIASGDTSSFVDIKDITMMFSVSDILGLNPLTRKILANAAGAAFGMASTAVEFAPGERKEGEKPVIGMTNLGVLTEGAMQALEYFRAAGYEVLVFHAVGSGGRAMEQLMKEGVIGAVFDYAMGEIADEMYQGLRAGGDERLTVAGDLGLPQVICPGGAEHIGLMVEADTVPDRYKNHLHVFHNPVIFAPRLNAEEFSAVANEISKRLAHTRGKAVFMMPKRGTSRYGMEGEPLHDPAGDQAFLEAIKASLPDTVELVERDTHAEDPEFVREAVERLIGLIEG